MAALPSYPIRWQQHFGQPQRQVPLQAQQAQQPQMRWLLPAGWQPPLAWQQEQQQKQQTLAAAAAAAARHGMLSAGGLPQAGGQAQPPAWPQAEAPKPWVSAAPKQALGNGSCAELAPGGPHQEQLQQGHQRQRHDTEQGHQQPVQVQAAPAAVPLAAEPSTVQAVQPSLNPEHVKAMLLQLVLPGLGRSKLP